MPVVSAALNVNEEVSDALRIDWQSTSVPSWVRG